jgi:hypothetical protein
MAWRRGVVAGALTALLVCGPAAAAAPAKQRVKKGSRGIHIRTATSQASGNGAIVTATAVCPRRAAVVTGGFALEPPLSGEVQGVVYESQRASRRSWRASAQIADPGPPAEAVTLTTTVSCRRFAPKLKGVVRTVAIPAAFPPALSPAITAVCPKGGRVISGGFLTNPPVAPGSAGAAAITVTDSYRSGARGWAMRAFGGGAPGSLTSIAYCARKAKSPVAVRGAGTTIATSLTESFDSAQCGGKKLKRPPPLGGGFSQNPATSAPFGWFVIRASFPRLSTWFVEGDHIGPTSTTLTSLAYCDR